MELPLTLSISGPPKTGKTHQAFTWPDPIVMFSFDLGAEFVRSKFSEKDITIKSYSIPIMESTDPKEMKAPEFYREIKADYKAVVNDPKVKTIIIDTGTHLWEIVRNAYQVEENRRGLLSRDYGEPNARMSWFLLEPRVMNKHLVTTQYMRDEYVADKPTGKLTVDGFKRTVGLADLAVKTERKGAEIISTITDCRFDLSLCEQKLPGLTYKTLMMALGL